MTGDGPGAGPKLETPAAALRHVGARRAETLAGLGVHALGDLLEYFPRTYQLESEERPIARLAADGVQTARGRIIAADYVPAFRRPRLELTLDDDTGELDVVFFHGGHLRDQLAPGQLLRVRGVLRRVGKRLAMVNPAWQAIDDDAPPIAEARFRPIYPASAALGSGVIAGIVAANLPQALPLVEELFEPALLQKRTLLPRAEAYRLIHAPSDARDAELARRRLVYDELMLMQVALGLSRRHHVRPQGAAAMRCDAVLDRRIRARFPFALGAAQDRCVSEIVADLRRATPMNRLLQGDVGSGKTAVAVYAMLVAVANRMQAALLAPTEVLAEQHAMAFERLLRGSAVRTALFTSRTRRAGALADREALASGAVHLAIGTQALLQEDLTFDRLALVVVDEQHKLGVLQRGLLRQKAVRPHYLVMTATPIPRTLALSYFADFDLSTIDEMPPGRTPVRTTWLKPAQAARAYAAVRAAAEAGRQAYVVFPQIDDELDEGKSLRKAFDRLRAGPLKGLRLAMLHGRMPAGERQAAMDAFREGAVDALVATTVIEVGVDVPNATVMVIERAEQFGLAQLHQLRGRVGRSAAKSTCFLIGEAANESAESRLRTMVRTTDGFAIAEADLALRGPGEFFGTSQHGLPEFRLADPSKELSLLEACRDDAEAILEGDATLSRPAHAALRRAVLLRFGATLALPAIG